MTLFDDNTRRIVRLAEFPADYPQVTASVAAAIEALTQRGLGACPHPLDGPMGAFACVTHLGAGLLCRACHAAHEGEHAAACANCGEEAVAFRSLGVSELVMDAMLLDEAGVTVRDLFLVIAVDVCETCRTVALFEGGWPVEPPERR